MKAAQQTKRKWDKLLIPMQKQTKKNKYKEIKMYSFLQARKIQYITLNDYEYTKKINTKILNCK